MSKVSEISSLLKKIHRSYSLSLLTALEEKGFLDLRASFLEILMFVSSNDAPSIKSVGVACGLKKQTMTSHLNELEKRGYIERKVGALDKRELRVHLTDYGQKFKVMLMQVSSELESNYVLRVGEVELDRIHYSLTSFLNKVNDDDRPQQSLF